MQAVIYIVWNRERGTGADACRVVHSACPALAMNRGSGCDSLLFPGSLNGSIIGATISLSELRPAHCIVAAEAVTSHSSLHLMS